jgi:excinuclease ABC subunit B
MTKEQLQKAIAQTRKQMEKAARELDFMEAARLRDEVLEMEQRLKSME